MIKFRVWDKEKKVMRYMSDGLSVWVCKSGWVAVINAWEDLIVMSNGELMQYTGLKDVKGREIYERDIVKVHDGKYHTSGTAEIVWGEDCGAWMVYFPDTKGICFLFDWLPKDGEPYLHIEVIGNVYENPELLRR